MVATHFILWFKKNKILNHILVISKGSHNCGGYGPPVSSNSRRSTFSESFTPFILNTDSHCSPLCPSSAHWHADWGGGGRNVASALQHALGGWASCRSWIQVDPYNMVGILPEPGAALWCQLTAGFSLLLADSGSQESKSKYTPVTQKISMAKIAFLSIHSNVVQCENTYFYQVSNCSLADLMYCQTDPD